MNNKTNGILNKISIKNKINILIVFIALTIFIISSVINIYQVTEASLRMRQNEVSAVTEIALSLIKEYKQRADKGELSEAEAQSRAIKRINTINFDGKNYVWINNYNNIFLAHPKMQGQDASTLKDKDGLKIIVEATKIAKEKESGSFKYYWTKPGVNPDKVFKKITYIRSFPEWNWVIGAGIYENDVFKELASTLITNSIVNLIFIFIIIFIANLTISKSITDPIENFTKISQKLAENDLTVQIPEDNNNTEIGNFNRSFKKFLNNLKTLIGQISKLSTDVTASSQEMNTTSAQTARGAQQTAQGAQEVSKNVEDGAANINKMNEIIQGISREAYVVSKLGNDTEINANIGAEQVKKAVNKIDSIKQVAGDISVNITELGHLSSQIEEIVDLIKNIAGQTNLLALNAAIEAARAGEHGKGFAVVADEVKKLAGQSAGATEKITSMIKEIQNKTGIAITTMNKATQEVEEGVFVINDAGKALENIISQVIAANGKIQGITKDIDGVAKNSEEMVRMIENISAITEETAASAEEISSISEEQTASLEEISASSQTLSSIAKTLNKQVSVFKI